MKLLKSLSFACSLLGLAFSWDLPLSTSSRWIVDSSGNNVVYAGVNWPGAADVMIPEGLQYQSIEYIVSKIKSLNMNVIRLTFPIEMVDDIYENGADVTIKTALVTALGETNGAEIYEQILEKNPSFSADITRLEVFDAVAAECAKQGIYVHLDNHVSKAMWCCSTTDGNAWFEDTYFNTAHWIRAWKYMAAHGKSWSSLVSVGMRNELRTPADNSTLAAESYNWSDWYDNMVAGADAIYAANPDLLIFFSGLSYDTTLAPIPTGADLGDGKVFNKTDFEYADKIVLELHNYQNSATSCSSIKSTLWNGGFKSIDTSDSSIVNVLPGVLTEFGYDQEGTAYSGVYASCLREWIPDEQIGWMIWVLAGSYYIRSGTQDYDESWGLLNHNWSDWRSTTAIESGLVPMINATLA